MNADWQIFSKMIKNNMSIAKIWMIQITFTEYFAFPSIWCISSSLLSQDDDIY